MNTKIAMYAHLIAVIGGLTAVQEIVPDGTWKLVLSAIVAIAATLSAFFNTNVAQDKIAAGKPLN